MTLHDLSELDLIMLLEGLSDSIRRTQESLRWSYDHKDWNRYGRRSAALKSLRATWDEVQSRMARVYGGAR